MTKLKVKSGNWEEKYFSDFTKFPPRLWYEQWKTETGRGLVRRRWRHLILCGTERGRWWHSQPAVSVVPEVLGCRADVREGERQLEQVRVLRHSGLSRILGSSSCLQATGWVLSRSDSCVDQIILSLSGRKIDMQQVLWVLTWLVVCGAVMSLSTNKLIVIMSCLTSHRQY